MNFELVDERVNTDSISSADDADSAVKEEPDISTVSEMSAELEEINASETAAAAFPDGEIQIGDDLADEPDLDEDVPDDFVDSLGMDLETNSAIHQIPDENEVVSTTEPNESAPIISARVSSDQIEAAIERVIMKILPEKIDGILSAAIERTLTREIEKIKGLLLEDSSGDNM